MVLGLTITMAIYLPNSETKYCFAGKFCKKETDVDDSYLAIIIPAWLMIGRYFIAWLGLQVFEHDKTQQEDIPLVDKYETEPEWDCEPWLSLHWNSRHVAFSFFYQSYHLYETKKHIKYAAEIEPSVEYNKKVEAVADIIKSKLVATIRKAMLKNFIVGSELEVDECVICLEDFADGDKI